MIRSSKVTIKFANTGKKSLLSDFLLEYKRVTGLFIDSLWDSDKIPVLLPRETTRSVSTWLSARAVQACGKQASGIIRGTRRKQERAIYVIKKLNLESKFKQARKLEAIYKKKVAGKPVLSTTEAELDSRFIKINLAKENSFDGWITIGSLGRKIKIEIPFRFHKHFNKMMQAGEIKGGIRLSSDTITFMFDLPESRQIIAGNVVGIDIGQKTTLSVSDGQKIDRDRHGHTYSSICKKLSRKKKGSEGFRKTDNHRTNYLHWCINRLELNGIRQVNLEKIRHLRKGKRNNRAMQAWNYGELLRTLKGKLLEAGVQIKEVNPTYTSQRCSKCGWTRKGNRKSKCFKCDRCGYAADADLNASINLSLCLLPIGKKERLSKINKRGFYWFETGKEPIVPCVQKIP
jgi:IS605 OrfB family transposase